MEEDIKILESLWLEDDFQWGLYDMDINVIDSNRVLQAIENLIARNKELEIINKMQEYRISVIDERELIPKSKVRELIQDIDETIYITKSDEVKFYMLGFKNSIQELLQEGDK